MIDYNSKYKFISDGTWFVKGTECIIEDGNCIWSSSSDLNSLNKEFSYEELQDKEKFFGLFIGNRICENKQSEGCPVGTLRESDSESCGLIEFDIIKR